MTQVNKSGPVDKVQFSGENNIDALLRPSWQGIEILGGHSVSYSFPKENASWDSYYYTPSWTWPTAAGGFKSLNQTHQQVFKDTMKTWSDVANINFYEIQETSSEVGDIRVAFANTERTVGFANGPGASLGGDVWLNANQYNSSYTKGQMMYFVLVHELGHALGFKHPHATDLYNDKKLPTDVDSNQHTVMSYTTDPDHSGVYASTPMVLDIQAMQYLYGANTTTRTGNDVYTIPSTSPVVMTIWDAGGVDTINALDSTRSVTIDLREGQFSSIGNGVTNNIGIAYNAIIENAVGGSGNDILIGNKYSNVLNGASGKDTVKYLDNSNGYVINIQADKTTVTKGTDVDTLYGIENVQFSDKTVSLDITGNAGMIYKLYQAGLNRTPDAYGLSYWLNSYENGFSMKNIANCFINSQEFGVYGNMTNRQFVDRLYLNVLDRVGEESGVNYWQNALDHNHISRDDLLVAFSQSSENHINVIGVLQSNGVTIM